MSLQNVHLYHQIRVVILLKKTENYDSPIQNCPNEKDLSKLNFFHFHFFRYMKAYCAICWDHVDVASTMKRSIFKFIHLNSGTAVSAERSAKCSGVLLVVGHWWMFILISPTSSPSRESIYLSSSNWQRQIYKLFQKKRYEYFPTFRIKFPAKVAICKTVKFNFRFTFLQTFVQYQNRAEQTTHKNGKVKFILQRKHEGGFVEKFMSVTWIVRQSSR